MLFTVVVRFVRFVLTSLILLFRVVVALEIAVVLSVTS
nr:MAG TPA_asm: hypothetical protein [Caudoviricetes sp.]